jgi:serine/threonine protein kinase
MQSSSGGSDDKWLGEFIFGPGGEARDVDSTGSATSLPPAWMQLIDGLSPGESIGLIGPYRIDKMLGRGGMGVVFKAWDNNLNRFVAIKFLSPRLAVSPLARTRFTREAQAAAAISHTNVVRIHSIGEHEGLPYMEMEYVPGITLAERLNRDGVLQLKSILRIGIQCAGGLAAAHAQGLIHRDVKPANILLESGIDQVKITDFGLAYIAAEPWRLTASGVLLGTPAYMSPEQAAGAALDHRSDLFSLGSVLYQMCTGEPPFPGPSVKTILNRVRNDEPRPIRDLNPDIPPALEKHISRLMAKIPADRFACANELVRTLVKFLAETQGRNPGPSMDDPDHEHQDEGLSGASSQEGNFKIVDDWDDMAQLPSAKNETRDPGFAMSMSPHRRHTLNVVGTAGIMTVVVMTAIVTTSSAVWLWQSWQSWLALTSHGDLPILLLLVLACLAVLAWSFSRLQTAVSGYRVAEPPIRRAATLLKIALAAATLFLASGAAYFEWSAYAQASEAVRVINARWKEKNYTDFSPNEVEALIGRSAHGPPSSVAPGAVRVTYRWKGVFRNHLLHADYSLRSPSGNIKGSRKSYYLDWIDHAPE